MKFTDEKMELAKMELEPGRANSKYIFFPLCGLFLLFMVVQKGVNRVGLRQFMYRRACLPGWPLAGVGELGIWEDSHHPQN